MLNSYKKKISNKTIFYLAHTPPEQCAHNELELDSNSNTNSMFRDSSLRLEMNWFRIDFRPEHLSPSFSTMNKFSLVTCEYSRYLSSLHVVLLYPNSPTFTGVVRVSSASGQSNSLCQR